MNATMLDKSRWRLSKRGTQSIRLELGETTMLKVISGKLWVTLEGDSEDHALNAPDARGFTGPGLLVAEAVDGPARFELE